ncbi:uncharacterized protein LOC130778802 [Actinidia eriantha]|uniref:uncharacterized protein LOC130778802 n=1 Tax=Actinidia eriantha TaxID=165200 RepID=UPI00258D24E9|nr:uncharacterized protein LOC130778802 [Actinidia eriantha]
MPETFLKPAGYWISYWFDLRTGAATQRFTCQSLLDCDYVQMIPLYTIAKDPRNPNLFAVAGMMSLAFSDQSELLVSYSNEFIYLFTRDMGLRPDPDPASPVSMGSVAGEVVSELQSAASLSDMDEDVKVGPQVYKGHRTSETVTKNNIKIWTPKALDRATLLTNIEKVMIPHRFRLFTFGDTDDDDKDYDDAVDSNGFSADNSDDGDDEDGDGDCNDDDGDGHDDSSDGLSCDGCNDSYDDSSSKAETYRKKLGAPQGFILVNTVKADDKITGQWREFCLRARGAISYLDI